MERQIKFKLLGMDTDSDVSIIDGTSSIENHNVRFTVTEDGQADAAISNEKGTRLINSISLSGTPIGYCTLSDYIVIFCHVSSEAEDNKDMIYIYKYKDDDFTHYYTYKGNFGFKIEAPIECQAVWEREDLLKVFWVDGENPLRFLTIPKTEGTVDAEVSPRYFDAVKELNFNIGLESSIDVSKQNFGGTFPAGTIQYAFTYYTKYGSESNIFKVTPLFYVSNGESGAPSDRSVSCSFQIIVSKVDTSGNWDYLRVYSISRTAIDGTPVCKRVVDININDFEEEKSITYVDNGEFGETVDSTRLLYVGGERIVPSTIAQKDGTLFLGNYKIIRPELSKEAKEKLKSAFKDKATGFFNTSYNSVTSTEGALPVTSKVARKMVSVLATSSAMNSTYQYTSQLSDSQNKITTFKSGETYRIGLQFQDTTGRWSEPVFLFDSKNTSAPDTVSSIPVEEEEEEEVPQSRAISNPDSDRGQQLNFQWATNQDILIDDGGGSSGGSSSGSSSGNSSVSTKTVNSAVKALLPFGYLNLKLEKIAFPYNSTSNMLDYLKSLGYIRVRPIIVYPNAGNREVLFQGVANPTLKKGPSSSILDYRVPSWFFRPIESANSSTTGSTSTSHYGYDNKYKIGHSFKGVYPVYTDGTRVPYYDYDKLYHNSQAEFQYETNDGFWVDWSVLTVDSPDIRFDEQLSLSDLSEVKARVVGLVDLAGNAASYSIAIDGSTEPTEELKSSALINTIPMGNSIKVPFQYLSGNIKSFNYGACLMNYPFWIDGFSDRGERGYDKYFAQWYVYPWHRKGSLNNCSSKNMNNVEGADRPSMLKKKILANSRFCYTTVFGDTNESSIDIAHSRVFIQTSDNQIDRFPDGTLFKNSVDIVLAASGLPSFRAMGQAKYSIIKDDEQLDFIYIPGSSYSASAHTFNAESTRLVASNSNMMYKFFRIGDYSSTTEMRYYDPFHDDWGNSNSYHLSNDPIPVQYKTGSNCVIQLSSALDYNNLEFSSNSKSFKDTAMGHWLPLVEVYREVKNKFGGDSDDVIQQNAWLVAGKPVLLSEDIKLFWDYGDTYFQRYDCLKTMPLNDSAVNNIVEILSFFCETRINIDGRYDVNRGLQDNTTVTDKNFNQFNDVYTQKDNYFQYYTSDDDLTQLNSYKNQVTWSLTKNSGDLIDPWTNITLLNSLDLDGSKGQLRAIKNFNGQLYTFQDSGIAGINYNQNVVLNSENGVPVEIANSGKVTGSVYLSTSQGCVNKWAIADVGQGLIFLDSLNKEFNIFDGKSIVNLGERAKFQSWIRSHCGSTNQWNPEWSGIDNDTVTFLHDKDTNEILLTSYNFSVAYNLGLMKFTSFYSYEGCPWLAKINSQQILFGKQRSKSHLGITTYGDWKTWNPRQGDCNSFLGVFMPYSIQFIASDDKYFDYMKLFYNIEVRDNVTASIEDTYDREGYQLQDKFSFDHIRVTNSYQDSGTQPLQFKRNVPSNLKAKFRTWRIEVPRNANRGGGRVKDRIRDHYMTVTLSHNNEAYNSVKVHDIIASYMI